MHKSWDFGGRITQKTVSMLLKFLAQIDPKTDHLLFCLRFSWLSNSRRSGGAENTVELIR